MALTPVQEAQVLDLIAQQSALLSLAGVEATILSKLGATKVTLSDLPTASVIDDADLLLLRQGVTDKSVTGLTFKNLIPSTITTPPQFDNDQSIATTEFVQRALGSHSKNISVVSSTALNSASIGALVWCASTGPYVVTLPVISALTSPAGSRITIYCSASSVTIQRGSTDNILVNDMGVTSLTLNKGDTLTLVSDPGSGIWIAEAGSAQLGYSSSFGSSLAANGYQKLPSGLIIQWGAPPVYTGTTQTIGLPIAFPNNNFAVVLTRQDTVQTNASLHITDRTLSSFSIYDQDTSANSFTYIALGN